MPGSRDGRCRGELVARAADRRRVSGPGRVGCLRVASSRTPGYATVGTVGAGVATKVVGGIEYTKTGSAVAGLVGSGARQTDHLRSGLRHRRDAAAGTSATVEQQAGAGVAGLVGAGVSESLTQETGYGAVGAVGAGSQVKVGFNVYTKTGVATVGRSGPARARASSCPSGSVGSGSSARAPRASVFVEAGAGTVGTCWERF